MSGELWLNNRQRTCAIDRRWLRWLVRDLLSEMLELEGFDLVIHLVGEREMEQLNQSILQHEGSTDVITLDYSDGEPHLVGELFICVEEAKLQAKRFRTTWQAEVIRYIIHGVLHLRGYDDLQPVARRKMKREEKRLLREIGKAYPFRKLELKKSR